MGCCQSKQYYVQGYQTEGPDQNYNNNIQPECPYTVIETTISHTSAPPSYTSAPPPYTSAPPPYNPSAYTPITFDESKIHNNNNTSNSNTSNNNNKTLIEHKYVNKINNTLQQQAEDRTYSKVIFLDVSGSMHSQIKGTNQTPFDQAVRILKLHAKEASSIRYVDGIQVVLFGKHVYEPVTVYTEQDMKNLLKIVKTIDEPETRTHLAMKKCREMFQEHLIKYGKNVNMPIFHALFITDGEPTSFESSLSVKGNYDELKKQNNYIKNLTTNGQKVLFKVIEEIGEITRLMTKDSMFGSTFLQVGQNEGVTQFFKFLDDDLSNSLVQYLRIVDKQKWSADNNMKVFDVVDTATFDMTVQDKYENDKKKIIRLGFGKRRFWEFPLFVLFESLCD